MSRAARHTASTTTAFICGWTRTGTATRQHARLLARRQRIPRAARSRSRLALCRTWKRLRKDWDLYRFWFTSRSRDGGGTCSVRTLRGDDPVLYFQRMNRDGTKGVILTTRSFAQPQQMPSGAVTMFPKGLVQDLEYDVRFDIEKRIEKRPGRGPHGARRARAKHLQPGEIVYLNLADHPGSGTRHHTARATLSRHQTDRHEHPHTGRGSALGTRRRTTTGSSGYEVFRVDPDGARIGLGKICQGEYVFDHSRPGTDLISCRYEVRAIDGDDNVSPLVEAVPAPGEVRAASSLRGVR